MAVTQGFGIEICKTNPICFTNPIAAAQYQAPDKQRIMLDCLSATQPLSRVRLGGSPKARE
jgi:hypothetical protein